MNTGLYLNFPVFSTKSRFTLCAQQNLGESLLYHASVSESNWKGFLQEFSGSITSVLSLSCTYSTDTKPGVNWIVIEPLSYGIIQSSLNGNL